MPSARATKGGPARLPWRVAASCAGLGLALSIASVPVAAVLAQFGPAYTGRGRLFLSFFRAPDGTHYAVEELRWIDANSQAHRPSLMNLRRCEAVSQPGVYAVPGGGRMNMNVLVLEHDMRPAFLRRPPARGFTIVEAFSAGWPMHAAHSMAHLEAHPGTGRRERGLLHFSMLGRDLTVPVLPIWTGLLGNTLLYGGALLAAWWFLHGWRIARRLASNQCPDCGYPLDTGMSRCPECGGASSS
ncbi:MAG: hypothetical protein KIT54_11195 [Phycisphaeraceae bacterium]|nr:hypothetical protein [Phycisphaeraceae bacterium]